MVRLSDELPRKEQDRIADIMYVIFMDIIFTLYISLIKLLQERESSPVSTVTSNSGGFSKHLTLRGTNHIHALCVSLLAEVCGEVSVQALIWIDNEAVKMLATVH